MGCFDLVENISWVFSLLYQARLWY